MREEGVRDRQRERESEQLQLTEKKEKMERKVKEANLHKRFIPNLFQSFTLRLRK